ncbi:hypothetical protein ACVDG5_035755 [Mesorhizobium sp. ORM6]
MVWFFDYNCGVCRAAALDLQQALRNDPNVKLVFKELPVLGAIFQIRRRRSARLAHCGSGVHDGLPDQLLAGDGQRANGKRQKSLHMRRLEGADAGKSVRRRRAQRQPQKTKIRAASCIHSADKIHTNNRFYQSCPMLDKDSA